MGVASDLATKWVLKWERKGLEWEGVILKEKGVILEKLVQEIRQAWQIGCGKVFFLI